MDWQRQYADKLRDPRWIAFSDKVKASKGRRCEECGACDRLHAHHIYYLKSKEPWDHPSSCMRCLCERCHIKAHELEDATIKALWGIYSKHGFAFLADEIVHLRGYQPGTLNRQGSIDA